MPHINNLKITIEYYWEKSRLCTVRIIIKLKIQKINKIVKYK